MTNPAGGTRLPVAPRPSLPAQSPPRYPEPWWAGPDLAAGSCSHTALGSERQGLGPETGLCGGSVSTYPRGLLLGAQQRGIEAGRQAGGGEDLPEWDLGFPQEPERREK